MESKESVFGVVPNQSTLLKSEIKSLKKQLSTLVHPHKEAKSVFYRLHKSDEDIVANIRTRLQTVCLYESDKKIPWQLIKMATDWKYDQEVIGQNSQNSQNKKALTHTPKPSAQNQKKKNVKFTLNL